MDITQYLNAPISHIGSTVAVYNCPNCNQPTLKVNIAKQSKPYKCWANGCSVSDIRESLKLTSLPLSENKKPTSYNIRPIHLPNNVLPTIISDYHLPVARLSQVDNKPAYVTSYKYSSVHNVDRIDFVDGSKKKFLPSRIVEGRRKYGADYACPFFNEQYIEKGRTVFVVEGEKCAAFFTKYVGYLAISPPGFGWTDNYLQAGLHRLANIISGLLVIPDNDEAGQKKASLIRTIAWRMGIACDTVKLPYTTVGDDVVNLLNKNFDVKQHVTKYFNSSQ